MGEHQGNLFEPQFNRAIKVQGTDQRITSNAGVILLREAEHRLGLFNLIADFVRVEFHLIRFFGESSG